MNNSLDFIWQYTIKQIKPCLYLNCVNKILEEDILIEEIHLKKGEKLTEKMIDILINKKIKNIKVREYEIDMGNEKTMDIIAKIINKVSEQIESLSKTIDDFNFDIIQFTTNIENVISELISENKIDPSFVKAHIMHIIARIILDLKKESKMNIPALFHLSLNHNRFKHAIETMIISINFALDFGLPSSEIYFVWASAFLHDIWISFYKKEKIEGMSERELIIFKAHTIIWLNFLSLNQNEITSSAIIAGTHHEIGTQPYGVVSNFSSLIKEKITIWKSIQFINSIVWISDWISSGGNNKIIWSKIPWEVLLNLVLWFRWSEEDLLHSDYKTVVGAAIQSHLKRYKTIFQKNDTFLLPSNSYLYKFLQLDWNYSLSVTDINSKYPYCIRWILCRINSDWSFYYDKTDKEYNFLNDFVSYLK